MTACDLFNFVACKISIANAYILSQPQQASHKLISIAIP